MNKEKELDKDLKAAEIKKDRALEKDPDVFKQIKRSRFSYTKK